MHILSQERKKEEDATLDHLLQITDDITGNLLNVFHDFESSNYTFKEDYVTIHEMLENQKYYTSSNMSQSGWQNRQSDNVSENVNHEKIYELCTTSIVNSSVAISCGPYFDQDIMHAIEICYYGN